MPKETYRNVTLKDETYFLLKEISKNQNRSVSQTIHSLVTGEKYPQEPGSLNFRSEWVCLDCGHRSSDPSDKCPICKGPILARYIKLKEGISQIVPEGNRISQRPKGHKISRIGPRHNHERTERLTLFQRISSVLRGQ